MIQPAGCWNSVKGIPQSQIMKVGCWMFLDRYRYIAEWYRLCIPYSIYFRIVIHKDIFAIPLFVYFNISLCEQCVELLVLCSRSQAPSNIQPYQAPGRPFKPQVAGVRMEHLSMHSWFVHVLHVVTELQPFGNIMVNVTVIVHLSVSLSME